MAGDVDTLLLDKTGTITIGNRRATQFVPFDGFTAAEVGRLAAQASAADQTPEGKSIVELFHQAGGPVGAAAGQNVRKTNGDAPVPAGSRFVPFTAQTRMSGIDLPDGQQIRKGAPDAILRHVKQQKGTAPASVESDRRPSGVERGHAAAGQRGQPDRRDGGPGRHPQARHRRALRATAADGPADGDGHGRQPLDGRGDRRAGGRGRLHRRSDPRGQTGLHPQGAGRGQAGGHDGRRHQRRPRPGPGRRGRGHELRHPGRQGGGQHGRPRQRSHQVDRGRRDRQATAR